MNNRWKIEGVGTTIVLTPQIKELQEWISEKSQELNEKIASHEESMLIKALSDVSLIELKKKITVEQKRRKDFKL